MKYKSLLNPYWKMISMMLLLASCKNSYDTAPVVDTATITSLDCLHAHYSPVAQANNTYVGTIEIAYTGGNGGDFSAGTPISSTGVTGLTATLYSGTVNNGNGGLTYAITGTPDSYGYAHFAISFKGQNCTVDLPVVGSGSVPQVSSLNCANATINSQPTVNVPFNGVGILPYFGGNTLSYPLGTTVLSTGVTGLNATIQAGTLSYGEGNLQLVIMGTATSSGTAVFPLSFGGNNCDVTLTVP
ncbi:MAG: hypothetical protein QM737_01995 [Ferruginibacter sp.]